MDYLAVGDDGRARQIASVSSFITSHYDPIFMYLLASARYGATTKASTSYLTRT